MTQIYHQDNFATNLTSNVSATDTTSPLNEIPTVDAPFYLAFDATNINGHYEVLQITSKTATNVNHAALTYDHTTAEEIRCVCPAEEMDAWSVALGTAPLSAWASFTPSWTNLTVGNGGQDAHYIQIGKTIHYRVAISFGTTTSVGGAISLALPVTPKTYGSGIDSIIGTVAALDGSTSTYYKGSHFRGGTIKVERADGTYISYQTTSSTVPITWDSQDILMVTGTYEAA